MVRFTALSVMARFFQFQVALYYRYITLLYKVEKSTRSTLKFMRRKTEAERQLEDSTSAPVPLQKVRQALSCLPAKAPPETQKKLLQTVVKQVNMKDRRKVAGTDIELEFDLTIQKHFFELAPSAKTAKLASIMGSPLQISARQTTFPCPLRDFPKNLSSLMVGFTLTLMTAKIAKGVAVAAPLLYIWD